MKYILWILAILNLFCGVVNCIIGSYPVGAINITVGVLVGAYLVFWRKDD